MVDHLEKLRRCAEKGKKICVYGMGDGAEKIIRRLKAGGITPDGVFASDNFVRGQSFLGMPVLRLAQAEEKFGDFACVTAFALRGEACNIFYSLAKRHELYAPNLPPYGEGRIDLEYLEREKERVARVRSLLADEDSAKVFDSLLKYDITADINDIFVCESVPEGYYIPGGTHYDAGAYDGDTVKEYAAACPGYGAIVALEPSAKNFAKLCANTRGMTRVECLNAAAGMRDGEAAFDGRRGRGSVIAERGGTVKVVKIDSIASPDAVSLKIDGEGTDMDILCGAVNTVYYKLRAVKCAVYHRAYDLTDIPLWLNAQMPGAKLYLRNARYIPAFDVFVYAVR